MSKNSTEEASLEEHGNGSDQNKEAKTEETHVEVDQDEEIENLRKKVQAIEEEDEKLKKMQEEMDNSQDLKVDKEEVDSRSIYVGNVDYSVTPEELQQHFHASGTINRVTIVCDKWTSHPKGDKDSVANAIMLNGSLLKGRQLKVIAKRTNLPSFMLRGRGRGRGFRGRGFRGRRPYYHPYS